MKKIFELLKSILKFLWKHKKIVIMIICFLIITITFTRCFYKIKHAITERLNKKKIERKIDKIDNQWREKNEEIDNYNYDDTSSELDELIRKRKEKSTNNILPFI